MSVGLQLCVCVWLITILGLSADEVGFTSVSLLMFHKVITRDKFLSSPSIYASVIVQYSCVGHRCRQCLDRPVHCTAKSNQTAIKIRYKVLVICHSIQVRT